MAESPKKFSTTEIETLKKALSISKKQLKREAVTNKSNLKKGISNLKEDFGMK